MKREMAIYGCILQTIKAEFIISDKYFTMIYKMIKEVKIKVNMSMLPIKVGN